MTAKYYAGRPQTSKYLGVSQGRHGRFLAAAYLGRQPVHAGNWSTERQAAIARDRAVLWLGTGRKLNFPRLSAKLGPADPEQLSQQARLDVKRTGRRNYTSAYHGVLEDGDRFVAMVRIHDRRISVGRFASARDAAIARDRVLLHLQRSNEMTRGANAAPANFPDDGLQSATVEEMRIWARNLEGRRHPHLPKVREDARNAYFGVQRRRNKNRQWWAARLRVDGKAMEIGGWPTMTQAALAHDRAALFYLKADNPKLNFPKKARRLPPADVATLRREAYSLYKKTTSSRYRGVHWDQNVHAWGAQIQHRKRLYRLGHFASEKAAARAYDRAALELHGDKAKLNFVQSRPRSTPCAGERPR